jgi:hypothetical protein
MSSGCGWVLFLATWRTTCLVLSSLLCAFSTPSIDSALSEHGGSASSVSSLATLVPSARSSFIFVGRLSADKNTEGLLISYFSLLSLSVGPRSRSLGRNGIRDTISEGQLLCLQVQGLIRAIFSDTPLQREVLARIEASKAK